MLQFQTKVVIKDKVGCGVDPSDKLNDFFEEECALLYRLVLEGVHMGLTN